MKENSFTVKCNNCGCEFTFKDNHNFKERENNKIKLLAVNPYTIIDCDCGNNINTWD